MKKPSPPRIETAIRLILAPVLRQDGFSGSGRTFRRIGDGWVQVLNIQGSSSGGAFAINLAIHPLAIPDISEQTPDPKKITEVLCEFRRRLSETGADQWWKYEPVEESIAAAMTDATRVYELFGRKLYDRVSGPDAPMNTVTPADFTAGAFDFAGFGSTEVRMLLVLSLLRKYQRRYEDSRAFAAYGITKAGGNSFMISEFKTLVEQ